MTLFSGVTVLTMEAVIISKTYVNLYQTPLRKIPKTDIFMLVAVKENLKSHQWQSYP
jgi:hypothetical protein